MSQAAHVERNEHVIIHKQALTCGRCSLRSSGIHVVWPKTRLFLQPLRPGRPHNVAANKHECKPALPRPFPFLKWPKACQAVHVNSFRTHCKSSAAKCPSTATTTLALTCSHRQEVCGKQALRVLPTEPTEPRRSSSLFGVSSSQGIGPGRTCYPRADPALVAKDVNHPPIPAKQACSSATSSAPHHVLSLQFSRPLSAPLIPTFLKDPPAQDDSKPQPGGCVRFCGIPTSGSNSFTMDSSRGGW